MQRSFLATAFFAIWFALPAHASSPCRDALPKGFEQVVTASIAIDRKVLVEYHAWKDKGGEGEFDYEAPLTLKEYALKTRLYEATMAMARCELGQAAEARSLSLKAFVAAEGFALLKTRMADLAAALAEDRVSEDDAYLEFMTIQGLLMYTGTSVYRTVDLVERELVLATYRRLAVFISARLAIYC